MISSVRSASTESVGSSARIICGSFMRARAIRTLWFSPPESSRGKLFASWEIPSDSRRVRARSVTASALLSALFLIMKPMYGLVIPNTDDKVDFYIKPFSFMSDNGIYDISPSYINLWCTLFFILI